MKILVVGRSEHFEECRGKLTGHEYNHVTAHGELGSGLPDTDVVFDFLTSENPGSFPIYQRSRVTAFLNTWKVSLRQLANGVKGPMQSTLFGFNGFPTMFSRELLELSMLAPDDSPLLAEVCEKLGSKFTLVEDRVGMVTPRVICMIINEAYYTVQEGTAGRQDIDLAMKLGTNYPYGPFEWCDRIGLKYVYELLDAVYQDTRDERYKISALMKKEYLDIRY